MKSFYEVATNWWNNGRKIKGCVAMGDKRYLVKKDDNFELWAGRPDKGGMLAAKVTKDGVFAVNVESYNTRCYSVWWIFSLHVRAEYSTLVKNRNYTRVARAAEGGWVPFTDGAGLTNDRRLINIPSPMEFSTTEATEKKIRGRVKEWRALFNTMAQLLKKDLKRGEWKLDINLPSVDDPVDGGVALALLEWSRNRTTSVRWSAEYDATTGRFVGGYRDAENFTKNLIDKCVRQLRDKWRREAPDSVWTPVPLKG